MDQLVISLPQGPTKTASTLVLSVSTFYLGSYEGRIIYTSIEAVIENVKGGGHTSLVPCLTGANGGRAWSTSVGFDDKIREITANKFA